MRSFDFLFPGTPNLPANIKAPDADVAAATDFIRHHFTDAAASFCNALGITLPVPVPASPEVARSDAAATPSDGWRVAGVSVTPTLTPVTGEVMV